MVDSFVGANKDSGNNGLLLSVIMLCSIFIFGGIMTFLRAVLFTIAGERVVLRLRKRLFARIMEQEVAFFDEHRTGELVSRLADDCSVLQSTVTSNVSMALRQIIQLLGSLVVIIAISWRLTLVMLAVVPVVTVGAVRYGRYGSFPSENI